MVAGVAGAPKVELPCFRRVEDAAGELRIHQVRLLALVARGLDTEIFGAAADTLALAQGGVELVVVAIVQRVEGDALQ